MSKYKYFPCYKQPMCESLIVNDLIGKDDVLKETYYLVQKFRKTINSKDIVMFKELLSNNYKNISKPLKRMVETFRKQEPYILASFIYPYSNGRLEGINNLIKFIKRIAFGYRNFYNFKF